MAPRIFPAILIPWLPSHAFRYLTPLPSLPSQYSSITTTLSPSSSSRILCQTTDLGRRRQQQHQYRNNHCGRKTSTITAIYLSSLFSSSSSSSQSANDNLGGFHYDTVPRGTSYISQVSKHDLSERRRMKRSSSRHSSTSITTPTTPISQTMRTARISHNDNKNNNENYGRDSYADNRTKLVEEAADSFQREVFSNLQSMTSMLQEMRKSQSYQEKDIRSLSNKLADVAERLGQQQLQLKKQQMTRTKKRINPEEDDNIIDGRTKTFGKSLDGEFHRKNNNVIDGMDERADDDDNYPSLNYNYRTNKKRRTRRGMNDVDDIDSNDENDSYTTSKVIQLESRIRRMDKLLRLMEENVNSQLEYVDRMVNQRLDDIEEDVASSSPPPPPREVQAFMDEHHVTRPPLPPSSSFTSYPEQGPPPMYSPPPPLQDMFDNHGMDDDGRTYFQERNYNDSHFYPAPPPQIPQQTRQSNSANERSGGYHYNERNTSFISAFSKADNERRRQFQPFRRGGGKNEENINVRWNNNRVEPSGERLPRGVRYPPNREFDSFSRPNAPPPTMLGLNNRMMKGGEFFEEEGLPEEYFGAPYPFDEDGPMMAGEEGYLYNNNFDY